MLFKGYKTLFREEGIVKRAIENRVAILMTI